MNNKNEAKEYISNVKVLKSSPFSLADNILFATNELQKILESEIKETREMITNAADARIWDNKKQRDSYYYDMDERLNGTNSFHLKQLERLENSIKELCKILENSAHSNSRGDVTEFVSAVENVITTYYQADLSEDTLKDVLKDVSGLGDVYRNEKYNNRPANISKLIYDLEFTADMLFCSSWAVKSYNKEQVREEKTYISDGTQDYKTYDRVVETGEEMTFSSAIKLFIKECEKARTMHHDDIEDFGHIVGQSLPDDYKEKVAKIRLYKVLIETGEVQQFTYKTKKGFVPAKARVKSADSLEYLCDSVCRIESLKNAINVVKLDDIKVADGNVYNPGDYRNYTERFSQTIRYLYNMLNNEYKRYKIAEKNFKKTDFKVIEDTVDRYKLSEKPKYIDMYLNLYTELLRLDENSEEYKSCLEKIAEILSLKVLTDEDIYKAQLKAQSIVNSENYAFEELKLNGTFSQDMTIDELTPEQRKILDDQIAILNQSDAYTKTDRRTL